MPQLAPHSPEAAPPDKAVKILAKSLFRQLKTQGYDTRQIIALSSELLGLETTEFKPESKTSED